VDVLRASSCRAPWLTEGRGLRESTSPMPTWACTWALTSEWKTYTGGGPWKSKDKVSESLSDPSGYLWPETLPAVRNLKARGSRA